MTTKLRLLKIALIAASPEIVGGHSVQAQALTTELRNAGHEVDYIPIDARFPRGLRWIRRVPYLRTLLNEALYISSLYRLAGVDVVHVFSASYWSFLLAPVPALVFARLLRKPVIVHYHSGEADDHLTRWRTARGFLRLASEIVVPSSYLQRVFAAHGFRSRVIHNIVDTSRFHYRKRVSLRPALLSVRNLESYYDVENTVAAFALLKTRFSDATLTIAGSGSHQRALQRFAQQLGISGIRFLGSVAPSELPPIYEAADIFVNSSILDNQPVSILEAFASGLPVVSTPTGDIAAMLRGGDAGLLIDARDPADMADAVTRFLEEPGLAVKLADRARTEVESYTWRCAGDQWGMVYADVLGCDRSAALVQFQWNKTKS
jgi:glycosyltransferase involved in cell wall biosynthesis